MIIIVSKVLLVQQIEKIVMIQIRVQQSVRRRSKQIEQVVVRKEYNNRTVQLRRRYHQHRHRRQQQYSPLPRHQKIILIIIRTIMLYQYMLVVDLVRIILKVILLVRRNRRAMIAIRFRRRQVVVPFQVVEVVRMRIWIQ